MYFLCYAHNGEELLMNKSQGAILRGLAVKMRHSGFLLILAFCVIGTPARTQLRADKNWRNVEPETVTLLSNAGHKSTLTSNRKSRFSFKYGVRGEVAPEITSSELSYGHINWNRDSDWFNVALVTGDRSRIKDLGELKWSEILDVPFLPPSVAPHQGFRLPLRTETIEQSSDGQVTRVVAGHMYVVHAKNSHTDLYALFRVEKLVPSDEVTISWKLVPSPKR
jgi:hypothetical protein